MNMSIETVTEPDIAEIIAMAAELSVHEGMPPPDLTYEKLHEELFGPNILLYGAMARRDREVAGYALWTIGYTMQYGAKILQVADLFVRPAFRRGGIARSLMQHMASVATARGYRFLTVITFDENAEANAFYPACGAKLDQTKIYYFARKQMDVLLGTTNG